MEITKINYRFGDSSVPPPHHRSYTISLTPDSIRTVVDSYGDVIGDNDTPIDRETFDVVVKALENHEIRLCKSVRKERGCTGGTTESISWWEGEEEVFSASVYHCGGDDYGDLCGGVRAFAKELKKLVPDFAGLLGR
jgi:hypothetical protein